MSKTLELTKQLIALASITPNDNGCQELLINRLKPLGFSIERLRFGDVDNLWARRGTKGPLFAFVGHTDVVPPGPLNKWSYDPFTPTVSDDYLFGRGAADMKGSLAAMIVGVEQFISNNPNHAGSIAFLITSDEEGPSINGTAKVIEHLLAREEKIDYCLVGEPSSDKKLGDVIKVGRRGSLCGRLIVKGIQGHIAYPHLVRNPIHSIIPALQELLQITWDSGNEFFPPTSFQISNFHAGTGATNVIPGESEILFNFRYNPAVSRETLQKMVVAVLNKHKVDHSLEWQSSGEPFLTAQGRLVETITAAIQSTLGIETQCLTTGGTSDGRFIAPTGAEVVELGPCNKTIHQIDECVSITELTKLTEIYRKILENLFIPVTSTPEPYQPK